MNTIKLNGIHTNVGHVKLQNNKPKTMSNHVENYYIYMPMQCHFNGMLIMASCAL
jgi:hypothetical protein